MLVHKDNLTLKEANKLSDLGYELTFLDDSEYVKVAKPSPQPLEELLEA